MKYRYIVKRYLIESFEVEIEAESKPSRDEIIDDAEDPFDVQVLSHTVRPAKPAEPRK